MDEPILASVHGVNSDARKLRSLADAVAKVTGHSVVQVNYGDQRDYKTLDSQLRYLIFKNVALDLRLLSARYARKRGRPPVIDVIAHSFGTLAVHRALADGGASIRRLALLGCIMDQRLNWDALVDAGRVECPPLNLVRPFDLVVRRGKRVGGDCAGVRGFSPTGACVPIDHFVAGGHNDYDADHEIIARFLERRFRHQDATDEARFLRDLSAVRRVWLTVSRSIFLR
jgi:pimeloyl-ACP methyl ester carboxylesterase